MYFQNKILVQKYGCVPLPEWTGMDMITGMDYRNGHYAIALGALNRACWDDVIQVSLFIRRRYMTRCLSLCHTIFGAQNMGSK